MKVTVCELNDSVEGATRLILPTAFLILDRLNLSRSVLTANEQALKELACLLSVMLFFLWPFV